MTLQPMDVRGEAQLQPAYDVIEKAIADKAFPGATLAVGYAEKVRCNTARSIILSSQLKRLFK